MGRGQGLAVIGKWFPINRRHQGLATPMTHTICENQRISFQSIGVTKDWRPPAARFSDCPDCRFPINRRHQGLATSYAPPGAVSTRGRGFQSIGVTKDWRQHKSRYTLSRLRSEFPINRRHQGLATPVKTSLQSCHDWRFQSIGVTKDWRLFI